MRKLTIVVALLTTLVVSGCSTEQRTEEELGYLAGVKYYDNKEVAKKTNDELIELGRYTCELFDNNVTPNDVIVKVVERGNLTDPEALDYIVTNALLGFCPEYSEVLNYG